MVATATIAPLAGVITLGDPIINVSSYGDRAAWRRRSSWPLLAVITELALGAVQRAVTPAGLKLDSGPRHAALEIPITRREATT